MRAEQKPYFGNALAHGLYGYVKFDATFRTRGFTCFVKLGMKIECSFMG
jgi:hypothetical protein